MLSIAAIGSASGAAAYYASDNYYTSGQLTECSEWFGRGAEELGLYGKVDRDAFDAVLGGRLPNGSVVPDGKRGEHRPGLDLTFSAPKSVSLAAYMGGDERLLDAHLSSVKHALTWAEARLAQARVPTGRVGGQQLAETGNLIIALFAHDTSRSMDPQAHIHAVVANVTKTPDGQWRALAERSLWTGKTTVASVYNAAFRRAVETLGYETVATSKHGQFEIANVPREAIATFSQRRAEIEQESANLQHNTPAAMQAVALRTRGEKPKNVDRATLHAEWTAKAAAIGFQPKDLVAQAIARATGALPAWKRVVEGIRGIANQGMVLAERFQLIDPMHPNDPLVPERPGRLSPMEFVAAHAVAAGARHLSEREAAFDKFLLVKSALDLGPPVSVHAIEQRIEHLLSKGLLVAAPDGGMLTTAQAIAAEKNFLRELDAGRRQSAPLLARDGRAAHPPSDQEARAQAALSASAAEQGLKLTKGQMAAAFAIISGTDRITLVQGDAGSGKSSMLRPVARLADGQGHRVLGLAVSNAIAGRLGGDVGIEAITVARFLHQYRAAADPQATLHQRDAAIGELRGALLVVDEASMLSVEDATRLLQIANAAAVARVALVGDTKQLGAVGAGKPFALAQARTPTSIMAQNLRARNSDTLALHDAAQRHDIVELARLAAPDTIEERNVAKAAAERWVSLSSEQRMQTDIYVTGRSMRDAINREVQALRHARGELGGGIRIGEALSPVHLTREEQRHPQSYRVGQVVALSRPLTAQGLPKGRMTIAEVSRQGTFKVELENGGKREFRPGRLAANRVADAVRVYEPRELMIRVGDPVVFRANDHARSLFNNERAMLAAVDMKGATFVKQDGSLLRLADGDRMLAHVDLAYASNAHSAQGATSENAVLVATSSDGPLLNRSLLAMLFTRARDKTELITDALDKMQQRAAGQSGEKTSAIEIADKGSGAQSVAPLPKPNLPQREPDITDSLGRGRQRDFER